MMKFKSIRDRGRDRRLAFIQAGKRNDQNPDMFKPAERRLFKQTTQYKLYLRQLNGTYGD